MRQLLVLLALLSLPFASAVIPGDPGFRGCVVLLPEGQFQDTDCDKAVDVLDNCPLIPNPEQVDVDQNGLGDACDLVIDEVILEPEEPMQGRSLLVRAAIFNNRPYPLRNLVAKAEMPRLGQAVSQPIPTLAPGQRIVTELLLRVPECAPPRATDLVVYVEYPFAAGQKEVFDAALRFAVEQSGTCPLDPGQELTVVEIIELQDVLPDRGAVYPFTIKNNWPDSRAYLLSVQGAESWGTVTIEPGGVVVVPPGGSRQGALLVHAYRDQTGQRSFTFTVQARDDIRQTLLQADIKNPDLVPVRGGNRLLIGVLAFLGIIGLIALVVLSMSRKDRQKLGRRIEEIERDTVTAEKRKRRR